MDLNAWKRRKFTPTWGGNDKEPEPCRIVYHPPSVGWMTRWREVAVQSPILGADDLTDRLKEDGFQEKLSEWTEGFQTFREELVRGLVVGVENLTMDGKDVALDEALDFVMDNEGLREEVFAAIIAAGTLGEAAGKD